MIVYVESNFILEIALVQDAHDACEQLIALAENKKIVLAIPAFSVAETHSTVERRHRDRRDLHRKLSPELQQLARTRSYTVQSEAMKTITGLLMSSIDDERTRLSTTAAAILSASRTIPLTADVLASATRLQPLHGLTSTDAIVFASVLSDLGPETAPPAASCFLNRDRKGFDVPSVDEELRKRGCRLIPQFADGLAYVRSTLERPAAGT